MMKKNKTLYFLSLFLIIDILLNSCGPVRYVPVETVTKIEYRDSLIFHTDTVEVAVPYEKVVEIVPQLDTLYLETSVAKSISYVDTSMNVLRGEITNKPVKLEKEIQYVDRIQYRDSVVIKEVPVEVTQEVYRTPKWAWYTLGLSLLFAALVGLKIASKFNGY